MWTVFKVTRKGHPLFITKRKVSDLDTEKLSFKFKEHNFNDDTEVYVKCYENGDFDLRGKRQEYRLIGINDETITDLEVVNYANKVDLSYYDEEVSLLRQHGHNPIGVSTMYGETTFAFNTQEEANAAYNDLEVDKGLIQAWFYDKKGFLETKRELETFYKSNDDNVIVKTFWL